MSSIKESSLGLNYGWSYGETGWNSGMDENIVLTGFHANKQIKKILSTPPTTGVSSGDAYIVGSSPTGTWIGNYAKVAIYDRGSWLFATPSTGVSVYNKSNGCWYEYNNGWSLKPEAEESPYIKVKDFDFSTGYTITDSRQLLFYPTNQTYYQWSGAFPKVVPAGSTPATSGGIGAGAWVDRSDDGLRSDIELATNIAAYQVKDTHISLNRLKTTGFFTQGIGGDSYTHSAVLSSVSKAGSNPEFISNYFVLYDKDGKAFIRDFNKKCYPEQFGFQAGVDCSYLLHNIRDYAFLNGGGDIGPQIDGTIFTISKTIVLDGGVDMTGNFSLHHLASTEYPNNSFLSLTSRIKDTVPIPTPLTSGQFVIPLPTASTFDVNETVMVLGGQSTYDVNEEIVRYFAKVVDNTGGNLTLSVGCSYSMNGSAPTAGNRILRFDRLNKNTKIGNITLSRENTATVMNTGITTQYCEGCSIGIITGETGDYILCELRESLKPIVSGVSRTKGLYATSSGSSGRLLSGWGCDGAEIGFVSGCTETGAVFIEGRSDVKIGLVHVYSTSSTLNLISAAGESRLRIDTVRSGSSANIPHITKSQRSTVYVERVILENSQKNCKLTGCKSLELPYVPSVYGDPKEIYFRLDLLASGTVQYLISSGIISDLQIYTSDLTGITNVLFGNYSTHYIANLHTVVPLVAGKWVHIPYFEAFGSDYPYNVDEMRVLRATTSGATGSSYLLCKMTILTA